MTTILKLICTDCKNYSGLQRCVAFPKGIPEVIIFGENDHSKPLPKQENKIVFEKIE